MSSLPPAKRLDFDNLKLLKSTKSAHQEDKPADAVLTAKLRLEADKLLLAKPADNLKSYQKL